MSTQDALQIGSTSRVGKRRAAPYGQACLHCFKTKSKCVRQDSSDSCERCVRLKKDCSSADFLRKRAAQKPADAGSAAVIANLQAQNDDLNALLHKVVENSASPDALRGILARHQDGGLGKEKAREEIELSTFDQTSNVTTDFPLNIKQEQTRLAIFRNRKLPFLAFMYIPPNLSPSQLQEEKPLLFQAIMAVTAPSIQEKRARSIELKRLLAQKVLEGTESSLDLLLCTLTYLGWGYDTFVNKVPNSSPCRLAQIAMQVAYDLRGKVSGFKGHYLFPVEVMMPDQQTRDTGNSENSIQQTLETERAILGCYFLCSITASHYHRMEPMRWTSEMEEYLNLINKTKVYTSDQIFSLQVRMQVLAQQASEQRDQRDLERCQATINSAPSSSSEPLLNKWYIEALQRKLREATASIPPELKTNEIIMSQMHYTSFNIYETVHPIVLEPEGSSSLSVPAALEERECHYHTLQAIQSFFDNLSRFSSSNWAEFPFTVFTQAIRCSSILFRLSLPPAQRDQVRNTVDVVSVLDWIADKIKEASVYVGETASDDLFSSIYRISKGMRAYMAKKLDPIPEQPEQQASVPFMETPNWGNVMGTDDTQMTTNQWFWFRNFNGGSDAMPYDPSLYYTDF